MNRSTVTSGNGKVDSKQVNRAYCVTKEHLCGWFIHNLMPSVNDHWWEHIYNGVQLLQHDDDDDDDDDVMMMMMMMMIMMIESFCKYNLSYMYVLVSVKTVYGVDYNFISN